MTTHEPRGRWLDPVEGFLVAAILTITAVLAVCAAGCSFPDEGIPGEGSGEGEGTEGEFDPPPRLPWLPGGEETSGGHDSAGSASGGAEGASGEAESSSDDGSSEGSSGELGSSSEGSSTGLDTNTYGPCDESCVSPWGCTSNGTWEACVLDCDVDVDCPTGGVCSGQVCFAGCDEATACPDGAMCMGGACWWPT